MSDRYCASIRIGGRIERARVEPLLEAIHASSVALEWGDAFFEPADADELIEARKDGWLQFCNDQACNGEFPELECACRELKLSYRRHSEAYCSYDAEVADWRPGMAKPLCQTGSSERDDAILVPQADVKEALACLIVGATRRATKLLRKLCPDISELPLFEIV